MLQFGLAPTTLTFLTNWLTDDKQADGMQLERMYVSSMTCSLAICFWSSSATVKHLLLVGAPTKICNA